MSAKLGPRQVEMVLRRAAEIEAAAERKIEVPSDSERLDPAEVERLGTEAGLTSAAVTQALGEAERGLLSPVDDDESPSESRVTIRRVLPVRAALVKKALERFLRAELRVPARGPGGVIEWERARGLWPGLWSEFRFSRRFVFAPANRVETLVEEDGPESCSVTIRADFSEVRRRRIVRTFGRFSLAFGLVGLGGTWLLPGFGLADVLVLGGGTALAGGAVALERRRHAESLERVRASAARFLDRLAARRRG